jgi:hypothetical protein
MILQTTTKQYKKEGTKTVFETSETRKELITENEFNLTTSKETLSWFRRLGGSETLDCAYTCNGYVPTKSTSTRPDKEKRTIREFKHFSFSSYKEEMMYKDLFQSMNTEGLFKLKRFTRLLTLAQVKQIIKTKSN